MVLPATINSDESLARYLTQSNQYSLSTCSVKPKAFEPPPNLCLSVFRIDGLAIEDVWQIGQEQVINRMVQDRNLYGMADIKAEKVRDLNLSIDADNNPPRHASIVGWPQKKSKQKLITQELAANSKLVL